MIFIKPCPICSRGMYEAVSDSSTYLECSKCNMRYFDGRDGSEPGYRKVLGDYMIDWYDSYNQCSIIYNGSIKCQSSEEFPLDITEEQLRMYLVFR